MFVVSVIPISRGAFKDRLSFFSKESVEVGVIIDANVRGKITPALVVEVIAAREEKSRLRRSPFALKKISTRNTRRVFPESVIEAVHDIALFHAAPAGAVFAYFTPSAIIAGPKRPLSAPPEGENQGVSGDRLILQAEADERVRMYRSLAREAFARGESAILVAPTIMEAETLHRKLYRGIDEQVILITSAHTKKSILAAWNRAIEDPEPLLIIITPSFLAIPRQNVSTYIVERESARSYVGRERPYIDARMSAEIIARKKGARTLLADFPIRVETRARLESGEFEELSRLQVSTHSRTVARVVDARKPKSDIAEKVSRKTFSVFTDQVVGAIEKEIAIGGRVFLYSQRRGLAPLTVCNDCGTPVTDPATGTPMTLHKTEAGNVFLSFYSGAVVPANISCRHCGSWNLFSLGIGVERVVEEASKTFPKATLYSLTVESAPTHARAKKIAQQFFAARGGILIGTDRALPYLAEPVELSVVVSIDSLLSIFAWRAHEYALANLFYLKDHSNGALYVQTRNPENPVIRAIATGNPTEFIRAEFRDRKRFGYPPFATFVGLTWSGTERRVRDLSTRVTRALAGTWDVVGPLPTRQIGRNRFLARAVVRLQKGTWPDSTLLETLRALPPDISVAINPDEIV